VAVGLSLEQTLIVFVFFEVAISCRNERLSRRADAGCLERDSWISSERLGFYRIDACEEAVWDNIHAAHDPSEKSVEYFTANRD
jgi:hypothetical protein